MLMPVQKEAFINPARFLTDQDFDNLFPEQIRKLSNTHWTPLGIARMTANFLAEKKGSKILDIGSGAGKFCLIGAHYNPHALFCGVEQRENLISQAESVKKELGLKNTFFIHANFTQLDLKMYDHFYFYNSFYENLSYNDKIDDHIICSNELYKYYTHYFQREMEQMPAGTRLATLCSLDDEIPDGFLETDSYVDGLLKFWIKQY
jgi:SAM-dependent methyltransferase